MYAHLETLLSRLSCHQLYISFLAWIDWTARRSKNFKNKDDSEISRGSARAVLLLRNWRALRDRKNSLGRLNCVSTSVRPPYVNFHLYGL